MSENVVRHLDPAIHRVRLDELRIFEISEAELEALERGSVESIFLNFAIATVSVALSTTTTLMTTKVPEGLTQVFFVVVTVVCYISGTVLSVLWWYFRKSGKSASKAIRDRIIPAVGVQITEKTISEIDDQF